MNFIGEFLILLAGFKINNFIIFFSSIVLIITLVYSLFFYTKVCFGQIKVFFIRYYSDLTRRAFFLSFVFAFLTLFFGIFPGDCLDFVYLNILKTCYFI